MALFQRQRVQDRMGSVSSEQQNVRAEFIKKTYLHLGFAILAFIAVEALLLNSPLAPAMLKMLSTGRFSWFIVLGGFMFVSYFADKWARSNTSKQKQYIGLGIYILAEAVIFVPLLAIATMYAPNVIPMAAIYTLLLFVGLTYTAFTSKKDFSFLGGFLRIGGFVALGFIGISMIFGVSLGMWFSLAMIIFASVAILYDTSNIMRHYRPDQYVAASLSLFASVALLFWYILQLLMSLSGDD